MREAIKKILRPLSHEDQIRYWGIVLCLIHLATFFFWFDRIIKDVVCSPLVPGCESMSLWLMSVKAPYLVIYALFTVFTALSFLLNKQLPARIGFIILFLMKLLFHLSDYRNMGNYHYIAHIFNLIFIFASHKLELTKLMIVLVYAGAGLLKFNSDWLSGAVITSPFYFSGKVLEWACVWVIFLELGLSWLLLGRNRWWRGFVFFQLVLFHLVSWKLVSFFSLEMLLLLLVFILDRSDFKMRFSTTEYLAISTFILAQLLPFVFWRHSALDGRGRIISLNLFDSMSVCRTSIFLRYHKKVVEYNPVFSDYGSRIKCDPWVLLNHLKKTCTDQRKFSTFIDADVSHQVKRFSEREIPVSFSFQNICSRPLSASWMGEVRQE